MSMLWSQWAFHVPNIVLAVLMYLTIGRLALSFVIAPNRGNLLTSGLVVVTNPVVRLVSFVTPAIVPPRILWLFTALWLFLVRIVFFVTMTIYGLAPIASQG